MGGLGDEETVVTQSAMEPINMNDPWAICWFWARRCEELSLLRVFFLNNSRNDSFKL